MARKPKDFMVDMNGSISVYEDYSLITKYFNWVYYNCAQARVSEIINVNNNTIKREPVKVKIKLRERKAQSFVFIHCLN